MHVSILDHIRPLNFHLSGSLKVKCESVTRLPIYGFLLMFNSTIWPNSDPLWYIRLKNVSDLEFDLSRSLNVKCDDVIGLSLFAFLIWIVNNSIHEHFTRGAQKAHTIYRRTEKVRNSFLNVGPHYWSDLPLNISSAKTINAFNRSPKRYLKSLFQYKVSSVLFVLIIYNMLVLKSVKFGLTVTIYSFSYTLFFLCLHGFFCTLLIF